MEVTEVLAVSPSVFPQIGPTVFVCMEVWESEDWLKAYTMILNMLLLVFPILLMSLAYGCVCYTLWIGIKSDTGLCDQGRHPAWVSNLQSLHV